MPVKARPDVAKWLFGFDHAAYCFGSSKSNSMYRRIATAFALSLLAFCAAAQNDYWQPVPSGIDKSLASVSFGSPGVGYIGGADSTLLRTVDGGISWQALGHAGMPLSASWPDIVHLDFVSASTGYAVVSSLEYPQYRGALCKTTDSGHSWIVIDSINIAAARSFFFDEQNGFVIGSQFFAGKTLHRMRQERWDASKFFSYDPSAFLKAIDFFDTSLGIVGGDGGQVYRSFDGGLSWDTVQTVVDTAINALKFLNAHTVLAGSDNNGGALLISYDTGRTWQIDPNTLTFSYPALKDIAVSPRDSFIAVGHVWGFPWGIILWIRNGVVYNMGASQYLNAVAMRDDSVAFIVGDSGLILSNRAAILNVPPVQLPGWRIYPNPASGFCHAEAAFPFTFQLYDMKGSLVRSADKPAVQHRISLRGLVPGVYLLRGEGPHQEQVAMRLVVE